MRDEITVDAVRRPAGVRDKIRYSGKVGDRYVALLFSGGDESRGNGLS